MAACFGLFYEALNPSPLLIGKVLQYGGTGVWITGTVLIARYASTERYVSNLISAILVSFFGLYAISMAQFVQFMADPTAEIVAGGRLFEHTLLLFPGTAILSLFLMRLWAVLLWVALSLVVPLQTLYAVMGMEEIYFTYDLTVLAVDGNAVNQDIVNKYRNVTIFFIVVLSGFVFIPWLGVEIFDGSGKVQGELSALFFSRYWR